MEQNSKKKKKKGKKKNSDRRGMLLSSYGSRRNPFLAETGGGCFGERD